MESKNRSRTYFVPLIHKFVDVHKSLLINTYLFDINKPDLNIENIDGLFLLFKWADNSIHKQYEQSLLNSAFIRDHYDIDTESYMTYFKFPVDIINDIDLIVKGKYSKLSIDSKKAILKYWGMGMGSEVYSILFKVEGRKELLEKNLGVTLSEDAELGSMLDYDSETFKIPVKILM